MRSSFVCKECGTKISDDVFLEYQGYCPVCFDTKTPEQLEDEEDA
jgi:rubrerythrin